MLTFTLLISMLYDTVYGATMQNQCFDLDPQRYCSNIGNASLKSLIEEIKLFAESYQFNPYGVAYNVTIFNLNDPDNILSSVIILGTNHGVSSLQLQWDVGNWFTDLILNTTQFYSHKNIYFEAYHNLEFGFNLCDILIKNDAAKYRDYINYISKDKEKANEEVDKLVELIEGGLKGKLTAAAEFSLLVSNSFDADLQSITEQYIKLFKYQNLELMLFFLFVLIWDSQKWII